MTKRELLAFLEPFDDDIDIKVRVNRVTHDTTHNIIEKLYFVTGDGTGVVDLVIRSTGALNIR